MTLKNPPSNSPNVSVMRSAARPHSFRQNTLHDRQKRPTAASRNLTITSSQAKTKRPTWDYTFSIFLSKGFEVFSNNQLTAIFYAAVNAAEEAIINALIAAPTMVWANGFTAPELPEDTFEAIMTEASVQ
ncbi:MAG: P1 family peptidase [Pseudomonadota bacterium]